MTSPSDRRALIAALRKIATGLRASRVAVKGAWKEYKALVCPLCFESDRIAESRERAEAAESRVATLTAQLTQVREALEKWARRADRGFDPEESDDSHAYWNGVWRCTEEALAALTPPAPSTGETNAHEPTPCARFTNSGLRKRPT